jgi:hypothetical protein
MIWVIEPNMVNASPPTTDITGLVAGSAEECSPSPAKAANGIRETDGCNDTEAFGGKPPVR